MTSFEISPSFIDSPQGRIFVVQRYPRSGSACQGVVLVPPFAEEMNRARRMMTLLAEQLAERGCYVVIPDLFGTGDSEGDFSRASWDGWVEQLSCCVEHMQSRYRVERYSMVAVRAGALLAADYIKQSPHKPTKQVLWQPTIDGAAYLTQFLRLRLAADMLSGGEGRGSVSSLKQALNAGETVEVAGYALSSAVSQGLAQASLKQVLPEIFPPTYWIDCMAGKEQDAPLATRELIQGLTASDVDVTHSTCIGPPFWSSAEIVENHDVVAKTVSYLCKGMQG
ncbi:hydrolase 2, exosortase A system-associated [Pseudomonadota bacterium]